MINKNILSKKSIYQNNIEDNPSLRTFRFRKIKLASLNKTILIPKEKSILSTSICNNTNLSIGNILPKKFEIKINKFYELENLNTLNKIHKKGEQIRLNLKNDKIHNNIFQNIRNLSPIKTNNKHISFNSCSNIEFNSFLQNKSENIGNSSLFIPLHVEDVLYKSKNKKNSINNNLDISKIKIESKRKENIKLKSIFKKDNNKISEISIIKKSRNQTILKSNIFNKKYITKNKEFDLKQKNKNFLKFIINTNNKEKIEEIDKIKKNKIKNNLVLSKQIEEKKLKIEKYKDKANSKTLDYFKSVKREIFEKIKVSIEISIYNSIKNISFNLNKLLVETNINGSIIQYLFLKYDIHKYLPSYLGISYKKDNPKIPSYFKKYLLRKNTSLSNLENEINSITIQEKEEIEINNIKICSAIYKNELKRNTRKDSKNFLESFSLLDNTEFFTNKKNNNNKKEINNVFRRQSYYFRNMYTNLNRRKSLPMKQILKKEDFLRLKSLIECKKENQFEYELHKLINKYDINSSDKHGNTLLTYACMNSEIYIIKYLLSNGANPNCINKYKNTPLHYALSNKNYEIADLLIKNKAKDNLKNIFGLTPW